MELVKKLKNAIFNVPKLDMIFLTLVLILNLIGIVAMGSASYAAALSKTGDSYYYIKKQAVYLVIGLIIMWVVSHIDYRITRDKVFRRKLFGFIDLRWGHVFYLFAIVLVILVLAIGVEDDNGISRSLNFGISVQPSEIFKFAMIWVLSYHFSRYYDRLGEFGIGLIVPVLYLAPLWLIWIEPHASCTIICLLVALTMMLAAGCMSLKNFLVGAVSVAGVAVFLGAKIIKRVGHFKARIQLWLLDRATTTEKIEIPDDMTADIYQTRQAKFAIGSGGLFGRGFGLSRQKMLYLPEPQNDFVFAIFCEECGFVFAVLVILLYVALIVRGIMIALKAKDRFGAFLAFGITMLIAMQAMLNFSVVTGVIPNTGISLPFFSYGGSALVMFLLEMGVILSVSRYSRLEKI